MRSFNGRGRRPMMAAAAVTGGLGLAGAAAGTAQAALPDAWGFALVQTPSGAAAAGHWAESVPFPPPAASPWKPGAGDRQVPRYRHQGRGRARDRGHRPVRLVPGAGMGPSGSTETVVVQCCLKGGGPAFVPFTVTFSASSGAVAGAGLRYACGHDTHPAVAASDNSTGSVNTVTALSPGEWLARLPGPGPAAPAGEVQVTAANLAKPAICDLASWAWTPSEQDIRVRCYDALGAPQPSGWSLTYQSGRAITGAAPRLHVYTLNNQPLVAGPYAPAPPGISVNPAGGVNTVTRAGLARLLIRFPLVRLKPDTVLVTATDPGAKVGNLDTVRATSGGAAVVRDVNCYLPSAAMDPTQSLVSYGTNS